MVARNDITGDAILTKGSNDSYRNGWDRIFGKKKEVETKPVEIAEIKPVEPVQAEEPTKVAAGNAEADAERLEWWNWCAANTKTVDFTPTFEEWKRKYKSS